MSREMQEIWVPIEESKIFKKIKNTNIKIETYKYEVSNKGQVRNANTSLILKQRRVGKNNSLAVGLSIYQGKLSYRTVAQLVATAFIPNPNDYKVVGHINKNKDDNSVENLFWTTNKEVAQRNYGDVRCSNGCVFESISDAAESLGISREKVHIMCKTGEEYHGFTLSSPYIQQEKVELPEIENLEGERWSKMAWIDPLFEISNKGRVKRISIYGKPEKILEPISVEGIIVVHLAYTSAKDNVKYRKQISPEKEVKKAFGIDIKIEPAKVYCMKRYKQAKKA